jgi:hypothetical protein
MDVNKKRCLVCKRKLGLADFYVCKCEKIFCKLHRYGSDHSCSYNYFEEQKIKIEKNNPIVIPKKIDKI